MKIQSFLIFCILPFYNRRVMLIARDGKQWSCNPKALANSLVDSKEWDICVGFKNRPNQPVKTSINLLRIGSVKYYYYLYTSRFFITNERVSDIDTFPHKRKGQIYIQTMHGGPGIKKLPNTNRLEIEPCWKYSNECQNVVLSNSIFLDNIIREGLKFEQPILHTGSPRNDIFYLSEEEKKDIRDRVFQLLGLPTNNDNLHIVVYAPTFRYGEERNQKLYQLDVTSVLKALSNRFGGQWKMVVHRHAFLAPHLHTIFNYADDSIIDGEIIEDIQQLLLVSDALITDYSSVEMDFCLTGRPQFQFFVDGADWEKLCIMDPKKLPFPYAETNEQLCVAIEDFDEHSYSEQLKKFREEVIKIIDDGHACENVYAWMKAHR